MLPHQSVEPARALQKLLVGAGFDDGSFVEHQQAVSRLDGSKTVCDGDRRTLPRGVPDDRPRKEERCMRVSSGVRGIADGGWL